MKKLLVLLTALLFLFFHSAYSQSVLDKVKQKVKDKTNQRVDDKTDKAIDNSMDQAENSTTSGTSSTSNKTTSTSTTENSKQSDLVAYGKYDFVPGSKIIFEDHVQGETLGEFPSKWLLRKGKIEVASLNGEQCIAFLEGNYATLVPNMTQKGDYLPELFTIEFDHYVKTGGYSTMEIGFHDDQDPSYVYNGEDVLAGWITTGENAEVLQAQGEAPSEIRGENYENKWHHVALWYNKGHIKIYVDQFRLCNLPNINGTTNPAQVIFGCIGGDEGTVYIKNVRIAAGGNDLYKMVETNGKIVTHGILFDVNKSVIKPESMGTLNEIVQLMKDKADLKFEVGGHTDSDGSSDLNMRLSQDRAEAVKSQLIKMGIDGSRLKAKGYGQSKPIENNSTPEGKANNRRVEFSKMN